MRSLSIHVQPHLAPELDMLSVDAAFGAVADDGHLVRHHSFSNGVDGSIAYFNYTFGTENADALWRRVEEILSLPSFRASLPRATMVMCSSERGWDDYLLPHHFDAAVPLDDAGSLRA